MSAAMARGLSLVVLLVAAIGCNASRTFIATSGDYADYRRVRVAEDIDTRLAAAWEYLEKRPDGQYAERLRRYFEQAEPVFFKIRKRSAKGLEAYLRALPDGPHAKEAVELLLTLRDEKRRDSIDARQALATGRRLDSERDKRESAARLLTWWTHAFLEPGVWSRPLSEAPKALVTRLFLGLPQPRCEMVPGRPGRHTCVKAVEQSFVVPGKGKMENRTIAFLLAVELDERWRVSGVTLTGSGILLATEEARSARASSDGEAQIRRATAAFVSRVTALVFEQGQTCNGGTDNAGRTELACEGLLWVLEPGRGGGDDVLWIRRLGDPDEAPPNDDDDDDDDHDEDDVSPGGDRDQDPGAVPPPTSPANEADDEPYD